MWVFLSFLAKLGLQVLGIPMFIAGNIIMLCKGRLKEYHKNLAIGEDKFGNVLCGPVFNIILIKKEGYQFGDPDETISNVEGHNEKDKTFYDLGRWICKSLNKLEKDHCKNSIK